MRMPFAKSDPIADAEAGVAKLEAQRARLADRMSGSVAAVEAAQRIRREALIDGDPDAKQMSALDLACSRAGEARSGVEEAMRVVAAQMEEAVRTRDSLREAAERTRIAADCEARAAALDAAAEALAGAAAAFNDRRAEMVTALAQHGARVDNPLMVGGITPASLLARPIVQAALRMAAPSLHEPADGLGVPYDNDPVMVMRRGQSGRLRDHGDAVREGRIPPGNCPRPGAPGAVPPDPNDNRLAEPMVRIVFAEPFSYLAKGGHHMVQGERGNVEVPQRVAAAAKELEIAFDPGTPKANAVLREIKAGPAPGYMKTPGRPATRTYYIDTDTGEVPAPPRTGDWPDADREVRRR